MKPIVAREKDRKIVFILKQTKRGQRGVGHGDGLERLLIVQRFTFAVRIPIAVADGPKQIFGRGLAIEKSE